MFHWGKLRVLVKQGEGEGERGATPVTTGQVDVKN